MINSSYIAHRFLTPKQVRVDNIMNNGMSFAMRLAAVNALDCNKGKRHGVHSNV